MPRRAAHVRRQQSAPDRDRVPGTGLGSGPLGVRPGRAVAGRGPRSGERVDHRGRVRHERDTSRWPSNGGSWRVPQPEHRELIIETSARQSFIGTAAQVAEQIDSYVQADASDGFILVPAPHPGRTGRVASTGSSRSCRTEAASAPSTPATPPRPPVRGRHSNHPRPPPRSRGSQPLSRGSQAHQSGTDRPADPGHRQPGLPAVRLLGRGGAGTAPPADTAAPSCSATRHSRSRNAPPAPVRRRASSADSSPTDRAAAARHNSRRPARSSSEPDQPAVPPDAQVVRTRRTAHDGSPGTAGLAPAPGTTSSNGGGEILGKAGQVSSLGGEVVEDGRLGNCAGARRARAAMPAS